MTWLIVLKFLKFNNQNIYIKLFIMVPPNKFINQIKAEDIIIDTQKIKFGKLNERFKSTFTKFWL